MLMTDSSGICCIVCNPFYENYNPVWKYVKLAYLIMHTIALEGE